VGSNFLCNFVGKIKLNQQYEDRINHETSVREAADAGVRNAAADDAAGDES
jgi:hypothetical protein